VYSGHALKNRTNGFKLRKSKQPTVHRFDAGIPVYKTCSQERKTTPNINDSGSYNHLTNRKYSLH
jgi:hypothetical protein